MRVLVTGGAGYIGAVVAERLLEHCHQPLVLDNFKYGQRDALANMGVACYNVDFADPHGIENAVDLPTPEAVIHLGAESAIPLSMTDPGIFYRVNVQGGLNLLNAMHKWGIKKFIFSSTSSVYSPTAMNPLREDSAVGPVSPYGSSKLAFEGLAEWYAKIHGFEVIMFRYFNVAGATFKNGERPYHRTRLIPEALNVAQGKSPVMQLYGNDYPTPDGTCVRDYLHVQDVADAHLWALGLLGRTASPQIFNLGLGRGYSNLEVIQACRDVTGCPIPCVERSRRPGDPPMLVSDPAAAFKWGWKPSYTDLTSIIETAWAWQQKDIA